MDDGLDRDRKEKRAEDYMDTNRRPFAADEYKNDPRNPNVKSGKQPAHERKNADAH